MGFEMKRVIDILQRAESIEQVLQCSYRKVEYPFTRVGVRARNLPLFNKELYELIIALGRLPEVTYYEEYYIRKYSTRGLNDKALQYHANIAYKALVLDLHFYFVLKQSKLFDDVHMEYAHDVAAQTDILLRKNGIELGLQVFSGDQNYEMTKRNSIEKKQSQVAYQLMLYNVRDNLAWKRNLTVADGSQMLLFGEKDAQYIAEMITSAITPTIQVSQNEDQFALLPVEPSTVVENTEAEVQYSYVYIGSKAEARTSYMKQLKKNGIRLFHCYLKPGYPTFTAKDGMVFTLDGNAMPRADAYKFLYRYRKYLNEFNWHQYCVEHASPKISLAINAGAGSGKTTTLVWRILYLLFTKQIDSLQQIVMITFTNEAANNMKEALEERLEKLYRSTGDPQHYAYLQEINAMKIVTIPTFAKDIIKQFSHHLGLSNNIEVSPMTVKFREILEESLDIELARHEENTFGKLAYYKITRFLESIWDKFSQKGIIEKELVRYLEKNEMDDELKLVVARILRRVDRKFTKLKFEADFLTVADLTRFLKLLNNPNVPLKDLRKNYKYLFVDEFQDTDIAQIQFIATVAKRAGLHLTVVGDTKQSVYRFRGADSTAFTVLDDYLKGSKSRKMYSFKLVENFRSSKELIEKMEEIFGKWREHELLPSSEKPMESNRENKMHLDHVFDLIDAEFTMDTMLNDYRLMPAGGEKPNVLAILVRNNYEAMQIGEMLSHLKNGPEYEVRTEGTLYMSRAARDLGVLLHSWIYANADEVAKKQAIFSLSDTAFCMKDEDFAFTKNGDIVSAEDLEFFVPKAWYEALHLMKEKPVLTVIEDFLSKTDFALNLEQQNFDEKAIMKYELNLEKITLDIFTKFGQGASLVQIYDWLHLKIATNREGDEAELEDSVFDENFIRVMTVHKSKGLQFHTVVIPYPDNSFIKPMEKMKEDFIVQIGENDKLSFGWKYEDDQNEFTSVTSNYKKLRAEEDEEQRCEEARILYVAMTRAEQSVKIYGLGKTKKQVKQPNTWGELLLM
ncbi:ATP-dependent helicase [Lysinibacillus sphaericus]|uniref:DNA 3'-5' helicase n=2 Tax=Lysinibacillus sphaericus TaxID=1421 RepID=A0A2S0JWW4_LYSSH|nr:ATP-dependent helicase [Lysinibacillus sphaericus]AVK95632.1 hypothetical protein LS41612_04760 [Lysinibacillus sphaericus]MED4545606.1 ATP-dependent helicase [Lysinibacillus sphaericus]TKI17598.1 ATP-dependent helicase [Lysinibacillus sphaericus]SUV18647.1 exodeoxyribonuclease V [Lysinibacillus sphaericus]GEC82767.1 hypothetical protein LSP03_25100 [Lysinibacillus sphaericus]